MKAYLIYEGDKQFIIETETLKEAEEAIEKYNGNGFHELPAAIERELTEKEMKSKEESGRYQLDGAEFTEGEEI